MQMSLFPRKSIHKPKTCRITLTTAEGLTAVTPTDRPTSVLNRCVSEVVRWRYLYCHDAFWLFLWM